MISKRQIHLAVLLMTAPWLAASTGRAAPLAGTDPVAAGFANPPQGARPRVWWHWMNGNVSKDGIQKDLAWMARSGLGGLQNFDAQMMTPLLVEKRLAYMDPDWSDAFKFSAQLAERKGLEFGIAASPGWSETGGPWVTPKDGMKKLVWSSVTVDGGKALTLELPALPQTTGPFQDIFVLPDMIGHRPDPNKLARFSGNIGVYAYPTQPDALPLPHVHVAGKKVDAAALGTLDEGDIIELAPPEPGQSILISLDYPAPQTIRSATLHFHGAGNIFDKAAYKPSLEASTDGKSWRKVAVLPMNLMPATSSFAPVTAAHFRVVVTANPPAFKPAFVPVAGADSGPFAAIGKTKVLRLSQLSLSAQPRVNRFEAKAGFETVDDYYALDEGVDPAEAGVAPSSVIELTGKVGRDGTLSWSPPPGKWQIVRLGYSLTGAENHPASPEATGLEVDKYDGAAVRAYLETYLGKYQAIVGKELIGSRGVRAMVTDSIEVGSSNWTPRLLEQFKRLRGYDARPWLPALTGVIIGNRARTDAFLYDYRRTLADLIASEHYGTVAKVTREKGIRLYGEALETARVTLGDDMAMRSHADVPMAAMWTYRPEHGPNPTAIADMRGAASVAHLYGQNLVAAESLTSAMSPWAFAPSDLRPMIDMEFASGVNLPVIHTSVHQPLDDARKPGLSLAIFGQYFNRNETWAEMARPWVDYMARSAFLLQQGRFYADVAYFYGEEAPLVSLYKNGPPADAPRRYAYDFVNPDVLLNRLAVKDGDLVARSGARYRVLFLGGSSHRMTLATLGRLHTLASDGATIVGQAPAASPALADDPAQFAALVKRLWSGAPETRVGKGRVVNGRDVETVLRSMGQEADFEAGPAGNAPLLFVHRRLGDGDVYFVTNQGDRPFTDGARFNVHGRAADLWHADTGKIEATSYRIEGNRTSVPLALGPRESVFVVFRRPAVAPALSLAAPGWSPVATLEHDWQVRFEGLGAPGPIANAALGSLTASADPLVKYFSGTAVYQSSFVLPAGVAPGAPIRLDLGRVGDVAQVSVNGKPAGIAWKSPYQVDIGGWLVPGKNVVEVRVANLWVNRMIGDAQPGAKKFSFAAAPTYVADAPLRPSGLIGPVTLQMRRH